MCLDSTVNERLLQRINYVNSNQAQAHIIQEFMPQPTNCLASHILEQYAHHEEITRYNDYCPEVVRRDRPRLRSGLAHCPRLLPCGCL